MHLLGVLLVCSFEICLMCEAKQGVFLCSLSPAGWGSKLAITQDENVASDAIIQRSRKKKTASFLEEAQHGQVLCFAPSPSSFSRWNRIQNTAAGRVGRGYSEAMRPQGVPGNAVDCILGGGVVSCRWVVDALALAMVIRVANERQGS